jgi:hypothetical protein
MHTTWEWDRRIHLYIGTTVNADKIKYHIPNNFLYIVILFLHKLHIKVLAF